MPLSRLLRWLAPACCMPGARVCAVLAFALAAWLGAAPAWAIHFDVELRTSNGPVAGSRITTEFYGDLNLAGQLPIDALTGYKIFPGYFGDLEGGPYLTDDPGFQAFAGTFLRREEVHFRALATLQHWDPATGRWGTAPAQVRVALFGAIPTDVIVGYTENPAQWQALYDYYAAGTRFSSTGIEGPPTAGIDDASSTGSFHAHLDWKISTTTGAEPPVGAYMVTLELWSTAMVNGQPKYIPSEPIQIVFERGISDAQMQAAILARVQPPPPPACSAATLNWLVDGVGCSGSAAATASGASATVVDKVAPAIGSASFACNAGVWGAATNASCAVPPPPRCAAQTQVWSVGGQQCQGVTAEVASGESATATDDTPPATGSAVFACSNGSWGAPTSATCAVPPPQACSAAAVSWTVGGNACNATLAAAASGSSALAVDNVDPFTGTARFTCSNGSWSEPSEASCSALPPPQACSGQTLAWTVNGESCSGAVPGVASGQSATATDAIAPAIGSAVFSCTNGNWGAATAASCAVPPPAACGATTANWSVGGHACSGTLPAQGSGATVVVSDTEQPNTGSASFTCSNGSWSAPAQASCVPPPAPQACARQARSWTVDGLSCSGEAAAAASGAQVVAVDDGRPTLGSATFSCSDGSWSDPQNASCRLYTPAACQPRTGTWTVGGTACEGPLPAAASGTQIRAEDTTAPNTGNALFACDDGQWSAPTQAVCTPPPAPQACAAGIRSWSAGAQQCSAAVAQTPSGQSVVATDTELPGLGSAIFSCSDGSWSPPASASCTAPPQPCSAAALSWTVGSDSCTGTVSQTDAGGEATAIDNTEPTVGSARFVCSGGSWGAPLNASCAQPPPRPCVAQDLGWTVGGVSCTGRAASIASGQSLTLNNAVGPAVGSAVFACSNGNWGAPASATCAVPPPRACSSQLLSWAVNNQVCQASVAGADDGAAAVAQDAAGPAIGTARFVCRDGIWQQQAQPAAFCGALQQASGRARPRSPWARPPAAPWQVP